MAWCDLEAGSQHDELVAIVAILQSDAVTPLRLVALLDHYGSAVELLGFAQAHVEELTLAMVDAAACERARAVIAQWAQVGLQVRHVLQSDYPSNLRSVHNRPPLVFIQGEWKQERAGMAVAVVGTRSASADGEKRAFRLARDLATNGIAVFSGLAKGIDAAAHRGALAANGLTVAVMGTGILLRYPKNHTALADQILAGGGSLLSHFLPEQPPRPWTFPARNIVMSGLSLATVVVEAGETSGARMQAEAALTHGRAVLLPRSLVQSHEWARRLIDHGHRGTRAIEVASADEVVTLLTVPSPELPVLSA